MRQFSGGVCRRPCPAASCLRGLALLLEEGLGLGERRPHGACADARAEELFVSWRSRPALAVINDLPIRRSVLGWRREALGCFQALC